MTKLCPVKTSPRLPEISFFLGSLDQKLQLSSGDNQRMYSSGPTQLSFKVFWELVFIQCFSFLIAYKKMQLWMIHSSNFKEMWFTWWCRKACHTGWPPPWPWRTRWRWPSSILKPKDPLWNIFNLVRFCGICPYIKVSDTFCTGEGKEFLTQPLVPNVHWGKLFSNFPSSSVVQLFGKWLNW